MTRELMLRRKWTFRAHGRQVVMVKKVNERTEHVLMKAFLWALYLPEYDDLAIEVQIGGRYKPDVVSVGRDGRPVFWGEAGQVSAAKIRRLVRRYRDTHLAIAKWDARLDPFFGLIGEAMEGVARTAPVDLLSFPEDSSERFLREDGTIEVTHGDLRWTRLDSSGRAPR